MGYNYGRPVPAAAKMNRLPAFLLFLAVLAFVAADLVFDMNFNWVDYTIVIVVALFGFRGYAKGMVNTVFSLVGYLAGIVMAFIFSPKLALMLQNSPLGKTVGDKLSDIMPTLSTLEAIKVNETTSPFEVITSYPEIEAFISRNPFIKQVVTTTGTAAETGALYQETVVSINDLLIYSVLNVLALIILFIGVKLIVVLVGRLLSTVINTTALLGTANRAGGMAVGLGIGLILVYIAFGLVIPSLSSLEMIRIPDSYGDSVVLTWFNHLFASSQ